MQPSQSFLSATDPEVTLAWIKDRITALYSTSLTRHEQQQLDRSSYLNIYNSVQAWCMSVRKQQGEIRLYHILEQALRRHCKDSLTAIVKNPSGDVDDALLANYLKHWSAFQATSTLVGHIFAFLDRRMRREIDEKKPDVYNLAQLHLRVWREEVLGMKQSFEGSGRILQVVKEQQEGTEPSKDVEEVLTSFEKCDVAIEDGRLVVSVQ